MAVLNSQFFNGHTYDANDFVESNKNTMVDGILTNNYYFKVTPGSNMTVSVSGGRGWVQGHSFYIDNSSIFTLANADGVADRIDTIIIRLDLTTNGEKIQLLCISGTLGQGETAPVRDGTYYDLVIAQIPVAHGTTSIITNMIIDKRGDSSFCGWSGAISKDTFNFNLKADTTYVNTQLAAKADTATVTTQLATKADTTYVDTQLENKINKQGELLERSYLRFTEINSTAATAEYTPKLLYQTVFDVNDFEIGKIILKLTGIDPNDSTQDLIYYIPTMVFAGQGENIVRSNVFYSHLLIKTNCYFSLGSIILSVYLYFDSDNPIVDDEKWCGDTIPVELQLYKIL